MLPRLMTADELAHEMGYTSANDAFRRWCSQLRITPVPGRRGVYDPVLVRRRLDEAQGLVSVENGAGGEAALTPLEQRRARRGAV